MVEKQNGATEYERGEGAPQAQADNAEALQAEPQAQADNAEALQAQVPQGEPATVNAANGRSAPQIATEVIPREGDGAEPAEASEAEPPKKKSKLRRTIWNIFLVCIIGLGIFVMFKVTGEIGSASDTPFVYTMENIRPIVFCIFVLIVMGIMVLDCAKFCIINKTVTGKVRFSSSMKCHFLGKYYDSVTPFATGGQPMQIHYLNTKGIPGGKSSAIVLIRYTTSILTWIILGAGLMIYGQVTNVFSRLDKGAEVLKILGWIGIAINLIIPTFVLLFTILPRLMHKLTGGIVTLGNKMKLIKNKDKANAKAMKIVDDFKEAFKIMTTTPLNLVLLLLVSFAEAFLTFSVPFFVINAFAPLPEGATDIFKLVVGADYLFPIMSLSAFATFGASFVPTPGNTGIIEGLGGVAFQLVAGMSVAVGWSVLFWRLGVFYIYILIGIIMTIRDVIKKGILADRKKKRLASPPPDAPPDAPEN